MLLLVTLSFAGFSLALFDFGTIQSVAVTGRLVCNGKPATTDVKVKLYEEEIALDRKMEEGKTNQTGGFHLSGSATEGSSIDPILYIYHKCDYGWPCYREIAIVIPKAFVTEGNTPQKTFDIGTINLAGEFSGEGVACFI